MSYNDIIQSEELIIILIIVVMSFIGSLSKDYMNLMKKDIEMKFGRILISAICSSMITYTLSAIILEKLQFRGLVGISYFIGLLGFELINKISHLSGVLRIISVLRGLDPEQLEKINDSLDKLSELEQKERELEEKLYKSNHKLEDKENNDSG